jgi:citrate lyase subunit beta/citryl-CoA lyase
MKPVRTALFAPGSKERVLVKAFESDADAVIFDLEDSVPLAAKQEARELVSKAIDRAHGARSGPLVTVRVNSAASGLLKQDLGAVVRPGLRAIFLPKAESPEEVSAAAAMLEWLEASQQMKPGTVEIVVMIESALGVYRCFDMLKASPRVATACIGSAQDGDLQTDLGCAWSSDGPELMYAKSKVLLDTRAAGKLYPLDGVFSDLNDIDALVRDSQISARLGYVGRTVIHPKQIAPVRRAYAVPAEQVAYYTRVVTEFEAAEKTGVAAIAVEGKLVDYAMYSRAKSVLEVAKLDG